MHGINWLGLELELRLYIKVLPNIFARFVRKVLCRGIWVVAEIGCRGYGLSGYGFGEMLCWGKGKGFSLRNLDGISYISLLANLASRINVSVNNSLIDIFFPNFNSFWCYTIQRTKRNAFLTLFRCNRFCHLYIVLESQTGSYATAWNARIYILAQVLSHYYSDYAISTT